MAKKSRKTKGKNQKKNITVTQLKQYLKKKKQEDLLQEVVELYKRFESVKDYYTAMLAQDDSGVLEKYKTIVENEFFPAKGLGKCRLSIVKKAIADYKKVSDSTIGLIDIMFYYVEMGAEFAEEYQVEGEEFYESMEEVFIKTLNLVRDNGLIKKFKKRCQKIVESATDAYGFQDIMDDYFNEILG